MYYSPWPFVKFCYSTPKTLDFEVNPCHTTYMKKKESVRFTQVTEAVTFVAEKLGMTRQEAFWFVQDHKFTMGTDRAIWLIV